MYMNYYSLVGEPFNITPDPAFLYLSPSHKEALGSIIYGIEMRKGFITITGEVGTGKTTIVRSCLDTINRHELKLAYLFNPSISFQDLMTDIFEELDIAPESQTTHGLVKQFHTFLIHEYRAGRNVVLIVDEAQNMPMDTLENLRVLSNLETTATKLLQIVLVGQPELDQKLHTHQLRQLRQRIAVRTVMRCLTPRQSKEYIHYRLSLVSPANNEVFTPKAVDRIILEARGVPRIINILCDNALIAGFGYQKCPVPLSIVEEVIHDYFSRAAFEPEPLPQAESTYPRKGNLTNTEYLIG